VRRQLINAAIRLRDEGEVPPNVDNVELDKVRSASLRLPAGSDWRTLGADALRAVPGTSPAAEVGLII
jgi:hypothetical protein